MMTRVGLGLLAGFLAACDPLPPAAAPLELLTVTPLTQKTHETKTVRVQLNADPPFLVDYDGRTTRQVGEYQLLLGDQRSVPLAYRGHGLFEGVVEPLARGSYPVVVRRGDGSETSFAKPYEFSALQLNYTFASVPPQVRGQPFLVKISVTLPEPVMGDLRRTAWLRVFSRGEVIFEVHLGTITQGILRQEVVIDELGDDYVLRLEDSEDQMAFSNAFPVAPPK